MIGKMIKIGFIFILSATIARYSASAFLRPSLSTVTHNSLHLRSSSLSTMAATGLWGKSSHLFMSSSAVKLTEEKEKVPITLLSGFLGAGKTSTLQHLLENTDGMKIGVIVNDVASVNIDAKIVSGKKNGVVELQNGCACCSLADELLSSVNTLLGNKREFDALVVELSGVADPLAIKSNWNKALASGHPVTEKADISQVVTLVDASTFGTDWMSWDTAGERESWVDPTDDCEASRKVPELLAEQVETADVILINKKDLAGPEQVKIASSLAKSLNKDAEMEEVEYGRVTPKTILRQVPNEILKKESSCCSKPDCTDSSHSHNPEHSSDSAEPDCTDSNDHSRSSMSTDDLGIVNFVYKANRPFNTKKLLALLNQWPVPIKDDLDISLLQEAQEDGYLTAEGIQQDASPFVGILRSKGFCWFAPTRWEGNEEDVWRHDTAMYWSHAGKHFGISSAGKWWGSVTQEQMKKHLEDNLEEYERILKEDFVTEEFGDRRQEIVFIGVSLDEEKITSSLDECLLTDKGLKRYRRELKRFIDTVQSDPFS